MSQKLTKVDFLAFEYYSEIEGTKKLLQIQNSYIPFPSSINSLENHSGIKALVCDSFGSLHSSNLLPKKLANQSPQNVWVRLRSSSQNTRGLLDVMIVVMKQLFPDYCFLLGFGKSIITFTSSWESWDIWLHSWIHHQFLFNCLGYVRHLFYRNCFSPFLEFTEWFLQRSQLVDTRFLLAEVGCLILLSTGIWLLITIGVRHGRAKCLRQLQNWGWDFVGRYRLLLL